MILSVLVIEHHHGGVHAMSVVSIVGTERPHVEYRRLVTPDEASR